MQMQEKTKGYPAKTPINRPQWQRTAAPPHTPNTAPPTDGIMREREREREATHTWSKMRKTRWQRVGDGIRAARLRNSVDVCTMYVHKSKKESYERGVQEASRKVKAADKIWVHDRRHA